MANKGKLLFMEKTGKDKEIKKQKHAYTNPL